MLGEAAQRAIEEKRALFTGLAQRIWENPETAFNEEKACEWTSEILEKEGFKVEKGCFGLPTAIRAVWGEGKPVIGFLGEYDALPGMSQKVSTVKEPVEDGAPGHACGHNLICAAHLGAAVALKDELEQSGLGGTVVFYGCPAEEVLTGKVFMARAGAFRDLDAVIAWHPGTRNATTTGSMTATNSAKFHFKGVTAHAGADPYNGRSALDAAELMNVGANFLREHVTDDVRIHYAFSDVHGAPNVVPDKASVWYYVRALSRKAVEDAYSRLVKIAHGAAMMTDTEVSVEFLGGCYNTLQNKTLVGVIHETMQEIPAQNWSAEDALFAEKLDANSPNYEKIAAAGHIAEGVHLDSSVAPVASDNLFGSTDVGDAQNLVPGVFFMTSCSNIGAAAHSWNSTACVGNSIGMEGMLFGAKVMAVSAMKLIDNPALLEKAKEDFLRDTKGSPYVCPIPPEVPVPRGGNA